MCYNIFKKKSRGSGINQERADELFKANFQHYMALYIGPYSVER